MLYFFCKQIVVIGQDLWWENYSFRNELQPMHYHCHFTIFNSHNTANDDQTFAGCIPNSAILDSTVAEWVLWK